MCNKTPKYLQKVTGAYYGPPR